MNQPDLWFRKISLAAMRMTDMATSGDKELQGATGNPRGCAVFWVGDIGFLLRGTDDMSRETSIRSDNLPEGDLSKFKNQKISAQLSKCMTEGVTEWVVESEFLSFNSDSRV